jgi:hypothetical protein
MRKQDRQVEPEEVSRRGHWHDSRHVVRLVGLNMIWMRGFPASALDGVQWASCGRVPPRWRATWQPAAQHNSTPLGGNGVAF